MHYVIPDEEKDISWCNLQHGLFLFGPDNFLSYFVCLSVTFDARMIV